ncbi:MAG: T9SS type A sorting domain-containing protein [Chitinophagales bacterium]|nr:T9SS type A sorting domain-containing protein [Chitinophagales bacterium]
MGSFIICSLLFLVFYSKLDAQCPQRYLEQAFSNVKITPAVHYGENKKSIDGKNNFLVYDMYQPKNDTATKRPLVVLIHAGGFTDTPPINRKSPEIVEIATDLAKKGYVVVSADYRLFHGETTYNKIATTVISAFLDINELLCYFRDSYENGNPFRIDTSQVFIGGSSAGALLSVNFAAFIHHLDDIPGYWQPFVQKVAEMDNIEDVPSLLANKFCGLQPKGVISISGDFVDTSFIQPTNVEFLIIHGMLDNQLPYNIGNALSNPDLPDVYGPGIYLPIFDKMGIMYEADIYPESYHVPVLLPFTENLPLTLEKLFGELTIYDIPVLDSTKKHISSFLYRLMGSPPSQCITATRIASHVINGALKIYPNPSNGQLSIQVPNELFHKNLTLEIFDISGKIVLEQKQFVNDNMTLHLNKGIYFVKISDEQDSKIYTDKFLVD